MAQPDFLSGEARTLLQAYIPDHPNEGNHIWLGARRVENKYTNRFGGSTDIERKS